MEESFFFTKKAIVYSLNRLKLNDFNCGKQKTNTSKSLLAVAVGIKQKKNVDKMVQKVKFQVIAKK